MLNSETWVGKRKKEEEEEVQNIPSASLAREIKQSRVLHNLPFCI
jgi:hypothetical protein